MKKIYFSKILLFFVLSTALILVSISCKLKINPVQENGENDMYDGPEMAAKFQFSRTKDPVTGRVPRELYLQALQQTLESKVNSPLSISAYGTWTERGPNSDIVGSSNGNTRANSGIASGRIRAILVDAADATGKTVWVGGVDGGLWKTTDITSSPATWTLVNDYLSNLAISFICQDPTNSNTMYFCTGEAYFNGDAVQGNGVFKSTDHGVNWTQLATTASYTLCTRILCDAAGRVYLATNGSGLLRSSDGGSTWTNITPTGSSSRIADIELSSTGRLHITTGLGNSAIGVYRFTDIPATVAAGTWTSATTPFTYPSGANCRVELACSGNTLFALPSNTSARVTTVYKSSDGGVTWAAVTFNATNQTDFNGSNSPAQAWYCLAADIDPSNSNNVIIGNLNCLKTTDGGTTWTKLSEWVGTSGQYVHADQHIIKWYDGGNKLLFGCDGGIHFSTDGGTTIRDRNAGLRIKQFYSCALNPTSGSNIFLAGAQDNGVHQFSSAGLGSTTEVTGGDGAFVAIDQNEPAYEFGSYVYNVYRRSTNTGTSWGSVYFYTGTNLGASNFGQFINPFDYDNTLNIIYAGANPGNFFRWTTPQTTPSGTYYESGSPFFPATAAQVNLTSLASNSVTAVSVSPYTSDKVYFGTNNGTVVYATGTSTIVSGSAGTSISTGLPAGATVSSINQGTDDNNLVVTFSNYSINNVWVSTNGGTSWTAIDGNLPNMPVYSAVFVPGDNTRLIIGTETGVWVTQLINGASTVWLASPTFPTVRTDMLQYRSSDNLMAAATHGRGLWTQNIFSVIPVNNFTLRGKWLNNNAVELNWDYAGLTAGASLDIEISNDGVNFSKVGSLPYNVNNTYKFTHSPGLQNVFYRIKSNEITGAKKYSNTVKLFKNGAGAGLEIIKLFPDPVQNELKVAFNAAGKGATVYSITSMSGQTIWRKQEDLQYTGNYIKNWNISGIPAGSYVLTISSGNEKVSTRFSKQ